MSRGSLIQLVAKGEMDKHLFSNDLEDSFFKKKVSRITNFQNLQFHYNHHLILIGEIQ